MTRFAARVRAHLYDRRAVWLDRHDLLAAADQVRGWAAQDRSR
jgi:hypothetical protein